MRIDDWIIAPGRQPVFAAILVPHRTGSRFADEAAEVRVCDDVRPGGRWQLRPTGDVRRDAHDVFVAALIKAAVSVEKLQRLSRSRTHVGQARGSLPHWLDADRRQLLKSS